MGTGVITMSRKEVDRLGVIRAVAAKRLCQGAAARQSGLSVRQVKRLVRRYRGQGAPGLVSRHRGRRPNNAIPEGRRSAVLALVRTHYMDFGPTLAGEKLAERHGQHISTETLRHRQNGVNGHASINADPAGRTWASGCKSMVRPTIGLRIGDHATL